MFKRGGYNMGLPQIVSRNTTQQNIGQTIEGRVTSQSTGLYTVPAGKTTKVLGVTGIVDGVGSDSKVGIAIKRGSNVRPIGPFVIVDEESSYTGELILQAGDIITTLGNAGGTNAGIDMTATIIEL